MSKNKEDLLLITHYRICTVKAPAFKRGDETVLNFLWFDATKN